MIQFVQVHVLLVVRVDEIVKRVSCDGQHGLAVALGVIEAIQQMHAARSRGRQAHAQPAGVLGIATGGESSRLLVANLNELDLVLTCPQRLEDAVDPIPRKPEDRVYAPVDQPLDHQVGYGFCH